MPVREPMSARRMLILGGTADARDVAAAAVERFGPELEVITSLAGRTRAPARYSGRVRIGGFGGAAGLAEYLRNERIDLLVDATHPFAASMSAHARAAADAAGIPLVALTRPAWAAQQGDRWIVVADAQAAATALQPLGRRIFLSFGGRELKAFATLTDKWFLVRRIERPDEGLPLSSYEITLGRGPFSLDDESNLLRRHRIDVLVTKASGGVATRAKLDGARGLGLPVIMIERPAPVASVSVGTAEDVVRRIAAALFATARY